MAWTADDLISAVRRRAQLPDAAADGAVSDADILEMANEELDLRLVPLVRQSRGDYWVTVYDTPIVSGTASYRVPERAQASALRDVAVVDSAGREWPIPQMGIEDAAHVLQVTGGIRASRFYMQGTEVVLAPTPTDEGFTLRMRYHRSHPTLVPLSQSGTAYVTEDDPTLLSVRRTPLTLPDGYALNPAPTTWSSVPLEVDVYFVLPPFGVGAHDVVLEDVDVTANVWRFTPEDTSLLAGIPTDVYMMASLSGNTSIVDLPRECWPLLVSALVARVNEVIGDRDAAQMAYALYERESVNVMRILTPRVEGNPQRIIQRNSALRSQRRW